LHFPFSRRTAVPQVTTLHGRMDLPDLEPLYREYSDMPLVSISRAQRHQLPNASWRATVPHGLPENLYEFRKGAGGYLAFLGRISPEKRVDRAIEIARRSGRRLRIAAKVDRADTEYFERQIVPLLSDPHVTFLGEIGEEEKNEFLGHAAALLFPIDWPEPFGLVMIEALGLRNAGHRLPGRVRRRGRRARGDRFSSCRTSTARSTRFTRIERIDRFPLPRGFRARFTAERMAEDYEAIYREVASHRVVPFARRPALRAAPEVRAPDASV
jgi:glycosyltransferase involved in cell wall biosynthesis